MLKGIYSFNKLCAEFETRRAFRDFCLFRNKNFIPTKRMLSEFRDHLKPPGFGTIAQLLTSNFLNVIPLPEIKVAVSEPTYMPANCRGFAKKMPLSRRMSMPKGVDSLGSSQRQTDQEEWSEHLFCRI